MKLNKSKIGYIIGKRRQGMSTYQTSKNIRVSERRVNQILAYYKQKGHIPKLGKNIGRPKKHLSSNERKTIIECYNKFKVSASLLRLIIKNKCSVLWRV